MLQRLFQVWRISRGLLRGLSLCWVLEFTGPSLNHASCFFLRKYLCSLGNVTLVWTGLCAAEKWSHWTKGWQERCSFQLRADWENWGCRADRPRPLCTGALVEWCSFKSPCDISGAPGNVRMLSGLAWPSCRGNQLDAAWEGKTFSSFVQACYHWFEVFIGAILMGGCLCPTKCLFSEDY